MAELITISADATSIEDYLAAPADDRPHPGVLLCADAFGLRPQIAAMCDRIASWGYVVLAPHLFHRSGSVAELAPTKDLRDPDARAQAFAQAMPRIAELTVPRLAHDLPAYLATLRANDRANGSRVGVVGYCMGARLAVRAAGLDQDVVAVGGFHGGGLVTDADDSPHASIAQSHAEYVFGHADRDRSMTPEQVAALGEALVAAGRPASNEIYPDAPHGYTMADTSSYQEEGAERHYRELHALLDRTLGDHLGDASAAG